MVMLCRKDSPELLLRLRAIHAYTFTLPKGLTQVRIIFSFWKCASIPEGQKAAEAFQSILGGINLLGSSLWRIAEGDVCTSGVRGSGLFS